LAVEGIPHLYHKYRELSPPEALHRAIAETNAEVNRRGQTTPDFHNMGTTCSVLVLLPQGALLAHIGDSRVYRLRGGLLEQLTFDHSLQWELRAAGQLPEGSDLAASVPKNVITRSLGPNPTVQTDLEGPLPIELGDVYLLCSDGLTGRVDDDELGMILGSLPAEEAAKALVHLVNLRGGPDNVTVLIARVVKPEITTAVANASPLAMGGSSEVRPVHPALWIAGGVCLLAGMVLAMMGQLVPGGLALLGGAIAGGIGVVQRYSGYTRGTALGNGRYLGRGPYTSTPCVPSAPFVEKLYSLLQELRQAARENSWAVSWDRVDEFARKAQAHNRAGQPAEGVAWVCRALVLVMDELRSQNIKRTDDSAIQY
jgi:protein phosphatase